MKKVFLLLFGIILLASKQQNNSAFSYSRPPRPTSIPRPTIVLPNRIPRRYFRSTPTPTQTSTLTLTPTPTSTPTPTDLPTPQVIFQDDFNSGSTEKWDIIGGIWQVINNELVVDGSTSPFPLALAKNVVISDYIIELDMKSITRVDKPIFVRYQDSNNYIDLNFRAVRPLTPSDVVLQETVNGIMTRYTPEFSVLIPDHQLGELIHVRLEQKEDAIKIFVNGIQVLKNSFPFSITQGRFGLGVFSGNLNAFDNIIISTNP